MSARRLKIPSDPFGINADTRYFFSSHSHGTAYTLLLDRLSKSSNFTVLIGKAGMGKTILLEKLTGELMHAGKRVIYPSITHWSFLELLAQLCECSGVLSSAQSSKRTEEELSQLFQAEVRRHRFLPVLIDEAQSMHSESLTGIWKIAEDNKQDDQGVSIVLAGDERLQERLESLMTSETEGMVFVHLDPLSEEEIASYIRHHLHIAGFRDLELFSPQALDLIARTSRGVPRLVNRLSSLSLHFAESEAQSLVLPEQISAAADILEHLDPSRDLSGTEFPSQAFPINQLIGRQAAAKDELLDGSSAKTPSEPADLAVTAGTARRGDRRDVIIDRRTSPEDYPELSGKVPLGDTDVGGPAESSRSLLKLLLWKERPAKRVAIGLSLAVLLGAGSVFLASSWMEKADQQDLAQKAPPATASAEVASVSVNAGSRPGTSKMKAIGSVAWPSLAGTSHIETSDGLDKLSAPDLAMPAAAFSGAVAEKNGATQETVADSEEKSAGKAARAVAPELVLSDAAGLEGETLPLALSLGAGGGPGEVVVLTIAGLPEGSTLSAGARQPDGRWALSARGLEGLELQAPAGVTGNFSLQVAAAAAAPGGDTARSEGSFELRLAARAVAPELVLSDAAGLEGEISEREVSQNASSDRLFINTLLSKGNQELKLKNISPARHYFELAAELGSAEAAGLVGLTYDPIHLKETGVLGMPGDTGKAAEWYKRAINSGDLTFSSRLKRLDRRLIDSSN